MDKKEVIVNKKTKVEKFRIVSFLFLFALSVSASAQKTVSVVTIHTSAQCDMCKNRIEKALAYEKGVVSQNLDLVTKVVTIEYKSNKTNPGLLRKFVSSLGYDADDVMADAKAYSALPSCCKKPEDPQHISH
jgi:copper chaperone CopZ